MKTYCKVKGSNVEIKNPIMNILFKSKNSEENRCG